MCNTYHIKRWKEKAAHEAKGGQRILLRYQISPVCQRMGPEDQTITWKRFKTIFKCKYFLLSLHLAQICTNNLEVTSYYILLSNPSDSAFFLFTVTVHWCLHSPLKMPVSFSWIFRPHFGLHFPQSYSSNFLPINGIWIPHRNPTSNIDYCYFHYHRLNQLGPKSKLKSLLLCSGPLEEGHKYSP